VPSSDLTLSFVRGPHVNLRHRYWISVSPTCCTRTSRRTTFGSLQFALVPGKTGFQADHYFRGGEWVHIACTWDLEETPEKLGGELAIFVNGRRQPFQPFVRALVPLTGQVGYMRAVKKKIQLSTEDDDILLGPFAGSMDGLRISDLVRYREDFVPSRETPQEDGNTRALFLFDGDLNGISVSSPVALQLEQTAVPASKP